MWSEAQNVDIAELDKKISSILHDRHSAGKACWLVLSGFGGVGKTHLAKKLIRGIGWEL